MRRPSRWVYVAISLMIVGCGSGGTSTSQPEATVTTTVGSTSPTATELGLDGFVAIHYEMATLFWDFVDAQDNESLPQGARPFGEAFVDLGERATPFAAGGPYALHVTEAGDALLGVADAIDSGDTGSVQGHLSTFISSVIAADTSSYLIVGATPAPAADRPYGADIGEVAYREIYPADIDAWECVTVEPCRGWFQDDTGSVADRAALEGEIAAFTDGYDIPLAVVVVGSTGRRHPYHYSLEMIGKFAGPGGMGEGGIVVVSFNEYGNGVLQGRGGPLTGQLSDLSSVGNPFMVRGDFNAGFSAILGAIRANLGGR